jgi:hypothetical protein
MDVGMAEVIKRAVGDVNRELRGRVIGMYVFLGAANFAMRWTPTISRPSTM